MLCFCDYEPCSQLIWTAMINLFLPECSEELWMRWENPVDRVPETKNCDQQVHWL